ncbi:MAG: BMP family ABC transporter substrate-binding protein, partial [Treponema sp.]|nr:BMP family ABC transporter substrate-binding protein [Treponema sp.]
MTAFFNLSVSRRLSSAFFILSLFFAMIFFISCSPDDETEVEQEQRFEKVIVVFHMPDALGDNSYTDILTYGIHKAAYENKLLFYDVNPSGWDDAKVKINKVFTSYRELIGAEKNADIPVLFIFTSEGYLDILKDDSVSKIITGSTESFTYLLFESERLNDTELPYLSSVYMPLYGASYLAGLASKKLLSSIESPRVVAMLANDFMQPLIDALEGYACGYGATYEKICKYNDTSENNLNIIKNDSFVVETISSDADSYGFSSESLTYTIAYDSYFNHFDLYFPVCGGSIHGLLRYNREAGPNSFYTVGMDSDMSVYSAQVPFSVVKHVDKAAEKCIRQWLEEGKIDRYQRLELEEGYTELVISSGYTELSQIVEDNLSLAIKEENQYYESK